MKISIKKIICHLMMLFIILNTMSVYERAYTDYYVSEIALILELVMFLYLTSKHRLNAKYLSELSIKLLIYFGIVIIFLFVNVPSSQTTGYIARFVVFIPLMILIQLMLNDSLEDSLLLNSFVNVMVLLSICSLFFWLFGTVLGVIQPTGQVLVNWGGDNTYRGYFGVYYEFQSTTFLGIKIYRNCSIFCEAPMFQFCLILAIAFIVFCNQSRKAKKRFEKFKTLILSVAVISSVSITGMISLILIFVLNYYCSVAKSRKVHIRTIIFFFIFVFGIVTAQYLFTMKSTSASWIVRTRSWLAYWYVFLDNPVFGSGYLNDTVANQYSKTIFGQAAGTSNSLASILGQGGVFFSSLYLFPIIGSVLKSVKSHRREIVSLIVVFFVNFMFTTTQSSYVVLFMLALLYKYLLFAPPKANEKMETFNKVGY